MQAGLLYVQVDTATHGRGAMPRLILLGYGLAAAQAYQPADVACIDASPALVVATTLCVARVCSQMCKYVLRLLGYGLATAMAFKARYFFALRPAPIWYGTSVCAALLSLTARTAVAHVALPQRGDPRGYALPRPTRLWPGNSAGLTAALVLALRAQLLWLLSLFFMHQENNAKHNAVTLSTRLWSFKGLGAADADGGGCIRFGASKAVGATLLSMKQRQHDARSFASTRPTRLWPGGCTGLTRLMVLALSLRAQQWCSLGAANDSATHKT